MGGIIDRLRSLLGRGDDDDAATPDTEKMDEDLAIERVEANMLRSRDDALGRLAGTHGAMDDPRG
ncbi:MAG TPA: hypothetical protein VER83_01365 [Candidatus Nanopelagicales bacterium]|nr:hypothetical protein [Candidatus Nanopelagicales bacterium]